jgi:hypothetical protein
MMGREIQVSAANEAPTSERPLNLGKAVPDCWFCLSNDQVLTSVLLSATSCADRSVLLSR